MSTATIATAAAFGTMLVIGGTVWIYLSPVPPPAPGTSIVNTNRSGQTQGKPGQKCFAVNGLPDKRCSPGAVRTQDLNIICHQSTKQFRPPEEYTHKLKKQAFIDYGYGDLPLSAGEYDHIVPLSLGGDGYDSKNLWPELYEGVYGAKIKDEVESHTKALVCAGKMDIIEAQKRIADDWISLGRSEGVIK